MNSMVPSLEDGLIKRIIARSPDPLGCMRSLHRIWQSLSESERDRLLCNSGKPLGSLVWFLGACPGMVPFLARHPREAILGLFAEGDIFEHPPLTESSYQVQKFLEQCRYAQRLEELSRLIAFFKNFNLVRLYAQEVLGLRPCSDIWQEWSQVASWCVRGALVGMAAILGKQVEGIRLAVLGMGKLGGQELNFCSDIDLIYVYEGREGEPSGRLNEVADRWARSITKVLEENTEEGPLFRVDLDLRPGGKDGPLVVTMEGAELYYQGLGSSWERWALLRAYPVAGDLSLGHEFLQRVEPFVFRTSLDYSVLEDIREMKTRIEREARWGSTKFLDVKMGQGGIRELEFVVQTLQIIHGGRIRELRVRDTIGGIKALSKANLLGSADANSLIDAYRFLRLVEHKIQMVNLRQTHRLPANEMELRRIALLMGYGDGGGVNEMLDELKGHMRWVRMAFEGLIASPVHPKDVDPKVEEILGRMADEEGVLDAIERAGFKEPVSVKGSLERLLSPGFRVNRHPSSRKVLQRILPQLLSRVMRSPLPDQALFRLERLLESIGPRAGYLALLEESPGAMDRLTEVIGRSAMLSRWLTEHIESLDALVAGHYGLARRSRSELKREAEGLLDGAKDIEERLGRLRVFRAQEFLRIGVGDLWGILEPWEVGQELTSVADVFLELTLVEVLKSMGCPGSPWLMPLSIVALGSFGGEELTYRSDLDLMFVYDDTFPWSPPKGMGVQEFLTRAVQRLISWMGMTTKEGPGWTIDARLRPSGTRGPLMVSLRAFKEYHEGSGKTWEKQMLLKSRPCAGSPEVGQKFMDAVDAIFLKNPDPDPQEFHEMRLRIERERAQRASEGLFHLKLGVGGMADIEFLVQFYQWKGWAEDPELRIPNTRQALIQLADSQVMDRREARFLLKAHAFLKGIENRLGLVLDHKATDLPFSERELSALGPLENTSWAKPWGKTGDLPSLLSNSMAQVRRIYLRHLGPTSKKRKTPELPGSPLS